MKISPDVTFESPFFIVGCVRSGTTMLRNLLRKHPNLACPEETHFYRIAEPFGTKAFLSWVTNNQTLVHHREIDQIKESEFAELLAQSTSRADLYRRYMATFVQRQKPAARRWFDKTPQNVFGVAIAANEIPDARFVHIVRDPVNVVSSLRIGKVLKIEELEGACSYWNESAAILKTLGCAYPDRLLEVRYEDLVARPQEFLERIIAFVGDAYDPEWFADINTPAVDHRDSGVLSDEEIDFVQQFCAMGRARYDYADIDWNRTKVLSSASASREPGSPSDAPESGIKAVSLENIPTVRPLVELSAGESYARKAPTHVHYGDKTAKGFRSHYNNLRGKLPGRSVFELPDVIVQGKGTMLIDEVLVSNNLEGAPATRELESSQLQPVRTFERPTLYTTRYGVLNYLHCLTDIVPRIVEVSRAIPDCDIALHPKFEPAAREALGVLGVDSTRLVELDEKPTRLQRGLFASPCSKHPLVHSPRALDIVRELAATLIDSTSGASTPTRLFVTCDAATAKRVTNYAQIERFLIDRGYEPITAGALDLATQIRTFANADEVIGIAGASMTNILFCAPGTRVTILTSSSMPALHFWDFAAQSRHDYRIGYFCAQTPAQPVNSNFTVDLETLASLL